MTVTIPAKLNEYNHAEEPMGGWWECWSVDVSIPSACGFRPGVGVWDVLWSE